MRIILPPVTLADEGRALVAGPSPGSIDQAYRSPLLTLVCASHPTPHWCDFATGKIGLYAILSKRAQRMTAVRG